MKFILNNFLRGLLFAFPLFATIYVITILLNWIDNTLYGILFGWLPFDIPGLGIITAFFLIVLLGFLVTKAFAKPLLSYFEKGLERIPLVKIIYTAFKELTEAFVGDKKRFNQPALVTLVDGVDRICFITLEELDSLHIHNRIAVYCPHSYNFSGNLFLVEPGRVRPLDIDPSEAMKFAVSAGVTSVQEKTTPTRNAKIT